MENSTADSLNDSLYSVLDLSNVDLWGYNKQLTQKSQKNYIDNFNKQNQQHLGYEITMYVFVHVSRYIKYRSINMLGRIKTNVPINLQISHKIFVRRLYICS